MRRRLLLGLVLLLLAGTLTLAWLGTEPVAWSLRAAVGEVPDETIWSHVPAGAPGVANCHLRGLLESTVCRGVRPELEALAAMRGADLSWFEERLEQVVVVHDGDAAGYALGSRLALSPLLLPRFDERWGPVRGGGQVGASDGLLALIPLEPGLVLATESATAGLAMQMALSGGAHEPPLALDEPGLALRARLLVTPALRAHARRAADRRILPLIEGLTGAELRLTALDELDMLLELRCRDASSAAAVEGLLLQLNFAAGASRQAGGLAVALFGEAGRLLGELPPLEIVRDGALVRVGATAGPDELRPWLRRALEALAQPA